MSQFSSSEIWIALQLCDSSLPGGAFSHSAGLESSIHHGLVYRTTESFQKFALISVEQAASQLLPLLEMSYSSFSLDRQELDWQETYATTDNYCHTCITNEVSRRASISQGKCLLRVALESFTAYHEKLEELQKIVRDGCYSKEKFSLSLTVSGHFVPLFGVICAILGVSKDLTERMLLRNHIRDLISAAARLNVIGPFEGSKLMVDFSSVIENLLVERIQMKNIVAESDDSLPRLTSPILELMQSRHDMLYSRLFNS